METTKGIAEAFTFFLRDGRRLCEVANKIKPGTRSVTFYTQYGGTIKRINHVVLREAKHHVFGFKAMENLWFFLDAMKQWVKGIFFIHRLTI